MNATGEQPRAILQRIARRVMCERGLLPDFSAEALTELGRIQAPATTGDGQVRDLRHLLWASIDNDDSRDLDQLTVAEAMPGGQDQDPRCRGRRGFGRQERFGHRRSRPPQHHLGLYGGHDLPDASREAVHRHHVPRFQCGPAGGRRRNGRRRGRFRPGLRYLPGACPEPGEARLQQRRGMAGRRGRRRQPSPPCPGSTRTCGSRTGRHSG